RVLYRLPELRAADPSMPVFLLEGEKDADALAALGFVATTSSGGAEKWKLAADNYNESLRGRDVVILPDNDDKGGAHAEDVARGVRIVGLPGLPDKGDMSDWLAAGHRSDELRELLSNVSSVGSVSSVGGVAEADMWPIPIELDDVLLGLEFPIDALPDVLRD